MDVSGNELWRINPANPGDETGNFGEVGNLPPGLSSPQGLVLHEGMLYCVESNGALWRINPANPSDASGVFGEVGNLPSGTGTPRGLASLDGALLCSTSGAVRDELWRINPDNPDDESGVYGVVGLLPAGLTEPRGLVARGGGISIGLAELGIGNVAELENAVASLREGESELILVDTSQPRIDLPNRTLLATGDVVEIEATGIHTLEIDGDEVNLGGEGAAWHWVQSLQEVQERPASATPPTTVNIRSRSRWISRESDGTVPRVERVAIRKDLPVPADGRRVGRELLNLHGRIKETLLADLITGFDEVVAEGSGVTLDQALIDRVPQVVGLTPTDVLRVERVEMEAPDEGDLIQQTLRLLRRADESRYRDDWRRTLLERVGSD